MRRAHLLFVWVLLFFVGCAGSSQADRTQSARLQELEARAEDLRARAEWEAGERARAEAALQQSRKELAGLAEEQERARARTEELTQRLKAFAERENAQRADLDLCRKVRSACEEERLQRQAELSASRANREEERRRADAELERCRGSLADLEARALLLSAEKSRAEREKAERVDELSQTYDELLAQAKAGVAGCEASLQSLVGAEEPRRRACGELEAAASRLSELFAPEVKGGEIALRSGGASVTLDLPESLFRPGTAELKDPGKALLRKLGGALKELRGRPLAVAGYAPAAPPVKKGKPAPLPWELAALRAARVAAGLEEAGVETAALAAAYSPLRGETAGPAAASVSIVAAEFLACGPGR